MKLYIPQNIFSTLFVLSIKDKVKLEIEFTDSSLIAGKVQQDEKSIGLIPSLDLINNRDLFVSSKLGIGFDGLLSNSYVYYNNEKDFSKILLRGDISINEAILTKIIYQERYNLTPVISLDTNENFDKDLNHLLVGNENWKENLYKVGNSFSEQINDFLEFPYINFLLASQDENLIKELNNKLTKVNTKVEESLENNLQKINFNIDVNDFIKNEITSVYFDLTDFELEGINALLQLGYFHQIFDDMFDIKFV